ncbi:hypothetical protein DAETH_34010 (plasmid) [Deinococcus aetherius]|uniref:ArsR family transcriptional regulator n=1 Tax=Deinococcus aetherius TaxID=200252 RepID=A0ABN6RP67_9DEIO|nr:hypothetical protein [Deinococcus aetherius]BDP43432.1 hypothetical protein DAETH_34010 [Deinococcus aetherius]
MPPDSTTLVVHDPEQAAFLVDATRKRLLAPFLGRERTVREAAVELREKPSGMSYWVGRMLDLGLLREAGTRRERGRSVRLYRSAADVFHIPFEVIPGDAFLLARQQTFGPRWDAFLHSVARVWQQHFPDGHATFARDEFGTPRTEFRLPPLDPVREANPEPIILNTWRALPLDTQAAVRLFNELTDLRERYEREAHERGYPRTFLLHLGLVEEARY